MIFLFIVILIIGFWITRDTIFTELKKIEILDGKIKSNSEIKIFQISDFHNFYFYNKIINIMKKEEFDFIVITGDIIDRRTKNLKNVENFINHLEKFNKKIFYVTGNHEYENKNYEDLFKIIEKSKIINLNNNMKNLDIKENKVKIIGSDLYRTNEELNRSKVDSFIEFSDKYSINILISHKHNIVYSLKGEIDLILAGHVHGGQIRLPIYKRWFPKGIKKYNGYVTYIDSGVGTSRLPIRLFCRSSCTIITIKKDLN